MSLTESNQNAWNLLSCSRVARQQTVKTRDSTRRSKFRSAYYYYLLSLQVLEGPSNYSLLLLQVPEGPSTSSLLSLQVLEGPSSSSLLALLVIEGPFLLSLLSLQVLKGSSSFFALVTGPRRSFFFFFALVRGPRRSLSLKLSDTRVCEPQIRARLGTTAHLCSQSSGQEPLASVVSLPSEEGTTLYRF